MAGVNRPTWRLSIRDIGGHTLTRCTHTSVDPKAFTVAQYSAAAHGYHQPPDVATVWPLTSASSAAAATARVRIASPGAQKTAPGLPERAAAMKRSTERSNGEVCELTVTGSPLLVPDSRKCGSRSRRSAASCAVTSTQ